VTEKLTPCQQQLEILEVATSSVLAASGGAQPSPATLSSRAGLLLGEIDPPTIHHSGLAGRRAKDPRIQKRGVARFLSTLLFQVDKCAITALTQTKADADDALYATSLSCFFKRSSSTLLCSTTGVLTCPGFSCPLSCCSFSRF